MQGLYINLNRPSSHPPTTCDTTALRYFHFIYCHSFMFFAWVLCTEIFQKWTDLWIVVTTIRIYNLCNENWTENGYHWKMLTIETKYWCALRRPHVFCILKLHLKLPPYFLYLHHWMWHLVDSMWMLLINDPLKRLCSEENERETRYWSLCNLNFLRYLRSVHFSCKVRGEHWFVYTKDESET